VAIWLNLCDELDVRIYAVQVVKEIQYFWYMKVDHERVINIMEPASRHVGSPAECQFLKDPH